MNTLFHKAIMTVYDIDTYSRQKCQTLKTFILAITEILVICTQAKFPQILCLWNAKYSTHPPTICNGLARFFDGIVAEIKVLCPFIGDDIKMQQWFFCKLCML